MKEGKEAKLGTERIKYVGSRLRRYYSRKKKINLELERRRRRRKKRR